MFHYMISTKPGWHEERADTVSRRRIRREGGDGTGYRYIDMYIYIYIYRHVYIYIYTHIDR